jgi:hypothetical protein
MADKANIKITLPRGELVGYPKLIVADTKFKAEGEFSVKVRVAEDAPGVSKIISQIDKAAADSLEAAREKAKTPAEKKKWETKYLPYTHVEDENGDRTGEVEFKATMKASGISKKTGKPWKMEPKLFDSKGVPIMGKVRDGLRIGNGSVGIIAATVQPYAPTTQIGASVKLSLEAVQLIKVVAGGANAAAFGFAAEEDGEVDVNGLTPATDDDTETSTDDGVAETEGSNSEDF